jgi:hypothetical protein
MTAGDRVVWAGVQNRWCAPGFNGEILSVARNDKDSIKVLWDERVPVFGKTNGYTWERRKNLAVRAHDG